MLNILKESLWKQFGASIDMVKNAILLSPDEHWGSNNKLWMEALKQFK